MAKIEDRNSPPDRPRKRRRLTAPRQQLEPRILRPDFNWALLVSGETAAASGDAAEIAKQAVVYLTQLIRHTELIIQLHCRAPFTNRPRKDQDPDPDPGQGCGVLLPPPHSPRKVC